MLNGNCKYLVKLFVAIAMCANLAGCMLGPDYLRPETAAGPQERFIRIPADWSDANDAEGVGPWWQHFGDQAITDLVRMALENNTDLRKAAAAVVEARALLAQSYGVRLPDISYGGTRSRGKKLAGVDAATTYTQDITISYVLDIFGRLKRGNRAAFDDMLAVRATRQALVHSIVAQVVSARVQIATQQRLVRIAATDIENRLRSLEIVERRYQQGLVSSLDVYLARENVAAVKATKVSLEQSLILAQHGLDVLVGRRPATAQLPRDALGDLPDLSPVPLNLPASLLDRRPDVRAAEMAVAAASERVGVSIATMYPDLTLTAAGGYSSGSYRLATATENEVYSLVMGLAAPIFKGGQLKAGVEAAKARLAQAAANYSGVVLVALREVEDALVRQEKLIERIEQLEIRLTEAKRAEDLARQRYSSGLENILIVLETERRRTIAENELTIAKGQLFNARIDLFLALGGDWQSESDESGSDNDSII